MQARVASRLFFALALSVIIASPALATDEMIFVYPGKPGTRQQAKKVLDEFTSYLEGHTGWTPGTLHADYFNDEAQALKQFEGDQKPVYGVVSLAIYLKWKKQGKPLTLLAQSELDKKPTMQFHLLVPQDSKIKDLASAKKANVASSFLEDRNFASKIVFGGALDASSDIAVIDTKSMGSVALPACARYKPLKDGRRIDALLVDDDQLEGMKGNAELFSKMRIAWSSEPLPTPPVVTFAGANAGHAQQLLQALTGMNGNTKGREILFDMTTTGFREPNAGAYGALEKRY